MARPSTGNIDSAGNAEHRSPKFPPRPPPARRPISGGNWRRFVFVLVALLIYAASVLIGWLSIDRQSRLVDLVVPKILQERVRNGAAGDRAGEIWRQEWKFDISSRLMFHNIQVSILAFATGALLGIGTFFYMAMNGLLLGGLAALSQESGFGLEFWALILPHGVPELLSVFVAGGAGLILGYSILAPGPHRRGEWFRHESGDAVRLLVGTVPPLVLAALVETWITPAPWPPLLKFFVAGGNALLLAAWSWWANRTAGPDWLVRNSDGGA